jgi:hypothetical protein
MKQKWIAVLSSFVILTVFGITLLSSCGKDNPLIKNGTIIEPCKNVVCYNGGVCSDGRCNCPTGFEGTDCNTTWNNRYTGTYDAIDQCSSGNNYTVQIAPEVGKADGIVIKNISKFCTDVNLSVTIGPDKTTLKILPQLYCSNYYISGRGTQSDDQKYINVWLTSRDSVNHTSSDCSITLRKK